MSLLISDVKQVRSDSKKGVCATFLIGDGSLPIYALEQIIEAYYSHAITQSIKVSFDYQFIANPAYNANRGPMNVFAGRFHTAF